MAKKRKSHAQRAEESQVRAMAAVEDLLDLADKFIAKDLNLAEIIAAMGAACAFLVATSGNVPLASQAMMIGVDMAHDLVDAHQRAHAVAVKGVH